MKTQPFIKPTKIKSGIGKKRVNNTKDKYSEAISESTVDSEKICMYAHWTVVTTERPTIELPQTRRYKSRYSWIWKLILLLKLD